MSTYKDKEDYVLELVEDYLENVDLYDGNMLEGLAYTLNQFEESQKEYALALFAALEILEHEEVKKVYTFNRRAKEKNVSYRYRKKEKRRRTQKNA